MYMVPPFLTYYAAQTHNISLLQISYDQCRLYRDMMQDPVTKTWRHILLGDKTVHDEGLWSTGNGWVAAGLMRVFATLQNIRDDGLRAETVAWQVDILSWVLEIINGAFKFQSKETALLPNYYGANDTCKDFYLCDVIRMPPFLKFLHPKSLFSPVDDDAAGTALMASAAYRLAALKPTMSSKLPMDSVDKARVQILQKHVNYSTGIVSPVVDPQNPVAPTPLQPTNSSAEAQAFVLLMISGWEAYQHVQLGGDTTISTSRTLLLLSFFSAVILPTLT